jgi:hypothetical protein
MKKLYLAALSLVLGMAGILVRSSVLSSVLCEGAIDWAVKEKRQ